MPYIWGGGLWAGMQNPIPSEHHQTLSSSPEVLILKTNDPYGNGAHTVLLVMFTLLPHFARLLQSHVALGTQVQNRKE